MTEASGMPRPKFNEVIREWHGRWIVNVEGIEIGLPAKPGITMFQYERQDDPATPPYTLYTCTVRLGRFFTFTEARSPRRALHSALQYAARRAEFSRRGIIAP